MLIQDNFAAGMGRGLRDAGTVLEDMRQKILSSPSSENPAAALDAGLLKRWIAQLPLMNVVETVTQLNTAIRSLNQRMLPVSERLKLLEVYRQAFDDILFTYDEFRIKLLPMNENARERLAADIAGLYLLLAEGYKALVFKESGQGRNLAVDSLALQAAYRAMELTILGLIFVLRMRIEVPSGAMRELHRLYALAEQHGVAETKIKTARRESAVPTIDRLYKQFWLLHVADSQGLNGAEWLEMYWLLEGFASACRLLPGKAAAGKKALYQIDLMADAPAALPESGRVLKQPRMLDINPALAAMNAWLAERQAKPKSCDNHEVRLLAMHMENLGAGRGRRVCRVAFERATRVALGLHTLRYFLQDKARLLEACEAEVQQGGANHHAGQDKPILSNWTIQDESEIGCQLQGKVAPQKDGPLLGNLLGVVGFEHRPRHPILSVGIVRWVKDDDNDTGLQRLGVEMMEGEAHPIVFAMTDKALQTAPRPALYIPKDDSDRPASLVLPRDVVASTIRLHVAVRGKPFEVMLHSVVRESPLYVQCRFKVARK